jgi:hypothetical protein
MTVMQWLANQISARPPLFFQGMVQPLISPPCIFGLDWSGKPSGQNHRASAAVLICTGLGAAAAADFCRR